MQITERCAISDVTLHKSTFARTRNLVEKLGKVTHNVLCGKTFWILDSGQILVRSRVNL